MKKILEITIKQGQDLLLSGTAKGDILVSETTGGSVSGDKLKGEILPLGTGITVTADNYINIIQSQSLVKTDKGGLIIMTIKAYLHLPQDVEESLINGKQVSSEKYYYKGTVSFDTGDKECRWLENKLFVCEGFIIDWSNLKFNVYEI